MDFYHPTPRNGGMCYPIYTITVLDCHSMIWSCTRFSSPLYMSDIASGLLFHHLVLERIERIELSLKVWKTLVITIRPYSHGGLKVAPSRTYSYESSDKGCNSADSLTQLPRAR